MLDPAAAGVHGDRDAIALVLVVSGEVDTGVHDGFGGRSDGEVDEAAHPPRHLAIHGHGGVEATDFGIDLDVQPRGIELRYRANSRDAQKEVVPVGLGGIADRGDGPEASYDCATGRILGGHVAIS